MLRVICPKCKEEGIKSRVYRTQSDMAARYSKQLSADVSSVYYDEEGGKHEFDPYKYRVPHACSNGHNFSIISQNGCINHEKSGACTDPTVEFVVDDRINKEKESRCRFVIWLVKLIRGESKLCF